MKIETKYSIGQWIRFKDYKDKRQHGEIYSIMITRDQTLYSTVDHISIEEDKIEEAR